MPQGLAKAKPKEIRKGRPRLFLGICFLLLGAGFFLAFLVRLLLAM